MTSAADQKLIDQAVAAALAQAQKGLVAAQSKPDLVAHLRKTWRGSAEHKAAQVKRFVYSLAGVVGLQLVSDAASGTDPLTHFTDAKTAWYYLLPFALVAWKQVHPSLSASEVDSAPGVTIVPDQVGAPTVDVPAPDATVQAPAEGDAAP